MFLFYVATCAPAKNSFHFIFHCNSTRHRRAPCHYFPIIHCLLSNCCGVNWIGKSHDSSLAWKRGVVLLCRVGYASRPGRGLCVWRAKRGGWADQYVRAPPHASHRSFNLRRPYVFRRWCLFFIAPINHALR